MSDTHDAPEPVYHDPQALRDDWETEKAHADAAQAKVEPHEPEPDAADQFAPHHEPDAEKEPIPPPAMPATGDMTSNTSPTPGAEILPEPPVRTSDPSGVPATGAYYDRIQKAKFDHRNQGHDDTMTLLDDLYGGVVKLEAQLAAHFHHEPAAPEPAEPAADKPE